MTSLVAASALLFSEYSASLWLKVHNIDRNAKRARLTALIKERADKNKVLVMRNVTVCSEVETVDTEATILQSCVVDSRYNYSRVILDVLNSCDSLEMTSVFRKHCSKDLSAIHRYTGSDEHNPLGPGIKHTEILGLEGSIDMWSTWFKYSPDAIYVYNNTSGSFDPNTGVVTSTSTYTNHFTRVLEGALPHVVCTYLPVDPPVDGQSGRDDLDCMLDAYFHDCLAQDGSPPRGNSPGEKLSTNEEPSFPLLLPSEEEEEDDSMTACFEGFQSDRLPPAFTVARDDDNEALSIDVTSPSFAQRAPTVTYIPLALESHSAPVSLLPTARVLSPLKRVAQVCVFDGCLTVTVDRHCKITHFEFTCSARLN